MTIGDLEELVCYWISKLRLQEWRCEGINTGDTFFNTQTDKDLNCFVNFGHYEKWYSLNIRPSLLKDTYREIETSIVHELLHLKMSGVEFLISSLFEQLKIDKNKSSKDALIQDFKDQVTENFLNCLCDILLDNKSK